MLFYVDIYIFYQFQMPYLKGTYFGSLFLKQPWLNLGLLVYNWNSGLITYVTTYERYSWTIIRTLKKVRIYFMIWNLGFLNFVEFWKKIVHTTFIVDPKQNQRTPSSLCQTNLSTGLSLFDGNWWHIGFVNFK